MREQWSHRHDCASSWRKKKVKFGGAHCGFGISRRCAILRPRQTTVSLQREGRTRAGWDFVANPIRLRPGPYMRLANQQSLCLLAPQPGKAELEQLPIAVPRVSSPKTHAIRIFCMPPSPCTLCLNCYTGLIELRRPSSRKWSCRASTHCRLHGSEDSRSWDRTWDPFASAD
jgi:hypothetical protein